MKLKKVKPLTSDQLNAARAAIAQMRQCARDLATSHPNRAQLANLCGEMLRRADELDAMLAAEAANMEPAAVVHDASYALMTQNRVVKAS
jgi:hypothetical protein